MNARVLGVDPGGMTGVAMIKLPEMRLEDAYRLNQEEVFDMAFTLVGPVDLIGIERYVINGNTARLSQQPTAMYVTGALMMAAQRTNVPVEFESMSDTKNSFPDTVLRQLDVWDSNEHVRDAIRCALLCARRHGEVILPAV
jgi:hypothetical protein